MGPLSPQRARRWLTLLLRVSGVVMLPALLAVFMPRAWMAATHRAIGLGEFPEAPIAGYLARWLSLFYFVFGLLLLMAAADLRRYRPVVTLIGWAGLLMAPGSLIVNHLAGMPAGSAWMECFTMLTLGGAVVLLLRAMGPDGAGPGA